MSHHGVGARTPEELSVLLICGRDGRMDALRRLLSSCRRSRFRIEQAAGVDEALSHARGRGIDVFLVDRDLAGDGAQDKLRELGGEHPEAAIVVFADEEDEDDDAALRALHEGTQDWLGPDELRPELIERALRFAHERQRFSLELERARQASEDGEERFRTIIQHNADGIVILDHAGTVQFVNPAAERLFGRRADSLIGEDFGFPVLAGDTTEIDVVRPGDPEGSGVAELRVVETMWEGEPALLVSLRDITDRKRAEERQQKLILEQAAREQAEWRENRSRFLAEASAVLDSSLDYETTLSSLADVIVPRIADWCVIDVFEEGRLRHVAVAHEDAEKEPLIRHLREAFPPTSTSPHPSARVLRTREPLVIKEPDQEMLSAYVTAPEHLDVLRELGVRSLMALPLESRGELLGVVTLVCAERIYDDDDVELAAEIGRRAAQAIDNARLYRAAVAASQAKSDFLAVVSHELRTPLNAIMGYTEILTSGLAGELSAQAEEHLRRVNASARHLLQIIEEILTFARMEAGREEIRLEQCTLGSLVDEVVVVAEPLAAERGLAFEQSCEAPETQLITDAGKIRQILLNLLSNAAKFTDEGRVRLTARAEGEDEVAFEVEDTGVGIAPEHHKSIFEAFWQAEQASTRRAGGTGLGLSVSLRLAEMLGGAITVQSQLGDGSVFTLRVPRHAPTAVAAASE